MISAEHGGQREKPGVRVFHFHRRNHCQLSLPPYIADLRVYLGPRWHRLVPYCITSSLRGMERETEEKGGGGEGEKRGKGEGKIKFKCGEMVDGIVRYHERRVRECYE